MASKDDYVPPEVKEKKKTKGGKLGNVASTEDAAASEASVASSPAADEWSQEQQVSEARADLGLATQGTQ